MANNSSSKPPKRNPLANLNKPEPPSRYTDTLGKGRKRRSDATGQKKDYHKGTSTLSVRLPDELVERVREIAAQEDMSMNSWLAQLITEALED